MADTWESSWEYELWDQNWSGFMSIRLAFCISCASLGKCLNLAASSLEKIVYGLSFWPYSYQWHHFLCFNVPCKNQLTLWLFWTWTYEQLKIKSHNQTGRCCSICVDFPLHKAFNTLTLKILYIFPSSITSNLYFSSQTSHMPLFLFFSDSISF